MFAIVTDTAANLSRDWLNDHHIHTVLFHYTVEGADQVCPDPAAFDPHAYYDAIRQGAKVRTSQITPHQYIECFQPLLEDGQDILFVGLSSGVSGSFASAQSAAQELQADYPSRSIRLVDTQAAGMGEGLMVMRAQEYQSQGLTLDETADKLLALRKDLCQVFTVEDLKYLRATGRLSGVKALVGTVLNVKPLLKGNDEGKIVSFATVRGRKQSISAIAQRYEELVADPQNQVVAISHADCPEDAAKLESLICANKPPKAVLVVPHEPMTGAHIGPGSLALFFFGQDGARSRLEGLRLKDLHLKELLNRK